MAKTLMEVLEECEIKTVKGRGERVVAVASCPFHEGDNTPSFTIYSNDTYYCFGCDVWGDAFKFLMEYKGWTRQQALDYLGEDYVLNKTDKNKVIKVKNTSQTWKFLWDVVIQYYKFLLETPGAIKYLYRRGLTDKTIERYKLGYTDGRVLNLQFAEELVLGIEIGLINKEGQECLSHRITIPDILEQGQCDFLIGRSVNNEKPKYLGCRMPKPIIGFYEVRHYPVIMVVEGQFDHLVLRQWGYPAVSVGGSHLTTPNMLLFEGKKVIIVPDNDDVGSKAAKSLLDKLGKNAMILDYTSLNVKDVGELAMLENSEQEFEKLVKEQLCNINSSTEALIKSFPFLMTTMK